MKIMKKSLQKNRPCVGKTEDDVVTSFRKLLADITHLVHVRVRLDHLAQKVLRSLVGHVRRHQQASAALDRLERVAVEAYLAVAENKCGGMR